MEKPGLNRRCGRRPLVNETVTRLGGERSLAAEAVWLGVGFEVPVSRWAVEHAGIHRRVAAGVLLVALGILAAHFAGRRSAA